MSTTTQPRAVDTVTDGRGPGGMWQVAWRLHRRTTGINEKYPSTLAGAGSRYVDSGYLDARGREVEFPGCSHDSQATRAAEEAAWEQRLADAGIVNRFEQALPGDRLTDLRFAVGALLAGIAALFLAASALIFRHRAIR